MNRGSTISEGPQLSPGIRFSDRERSTSLVRTALLGIPFRGPVNSARQIRNGGIGGSSQAGSHFQGVNLLEGVNLL